MMSQPSITAGERSKKVAPDVGSAETNNFAKHPESGSCFHRTGRRTEIYKRDDRQKKHGIKQTTHPFLSE